MKISAVISKDIIKRSGMAKNKLNLTVFLVIALALLSGTVLFIISEKNLSKEIGDSFISFYSDFSSKTNGEIFTGMLSSHLPYVILMIILGKSSVGYAVIPVLSFTKIIGISFLNTYLYSVFGLKGVEYSLLIFIPGKFLMIFSVIFLMQCCMENSLNIKNILKGESRLENNSYFYWVRITVAVMILTLSSLVDCILTVSFSSLFSF